MIRAVTGWDLDMQELLEIGERRVNMMRMFNLREGLGRDADRLPEKFFAKALKGGPTEGWKIDREVFENALTDYYMQSGWEEQTGVPKREILERLDLAWIADDDLPT